MATQTQSAAPAAIVLNAAVVTLLDAGCAAGNTADAKGREAAAVAVKTDFLTEKDKAKRIALIEGAYKAHLTHSTVQASFRSALVILVVGGAVKLAVAEKTELFKPEGKKLRLKGMDVLAAKQKPEAGKCELSLAPDEATAQLSSNDMKAVATALRESLGTGRAKTVKAKVATSTRAPFMDELTVAIKDAALSAGIMRFIGTAAHSTPSILASLKAILEAEGYSVTKAAK